MSKKDEALMLINILLEKMNASIISIEEYKLLQKLLIEYVQLFSSKQKDNIYPLCKRSITGDKIMLISDTHHGNKQLENRRFTDIAYNTAIKENIKTIIHAGDLTESTTAEPRWNIPIEKAHDIVEKELQSALEAIPNELQIKLLLGNHDYTTIKRFLSLVPYYTESSKIDILGMQRVLLDWDSYASIYLDHYISQLSYPEKNEYLRERNQASIVIEGHHHFFNISEENAIELPSLSNATLGVLSHSLYEKGLSYAPIYVIASKQDNNQILFETYCIDSKRKETILPGEKVKVDTKTKKLSLF